MVHQIFSHILFRLIVCFQLLIFINNSRRFFDTLISKDRWLVFGYFTFFLKIILRTWLKTIILVFLSLNVLNLDFSVLCRFTIVELREYLWIFLKWLSIFLFLGKCWSDTWGEIHVNIFVVRRLHPLRSWRKWLFLRDRFNFRISLLDDDLFLFESFFSQLGIKFVWKVLSFWDLYLLISCFDH